MTFFRSICCSDWEKKESKFSFDCRPGWSAIHGRSPGLAFGDRNERKNCIISQISWYDSCFLGSQMTNSLWTESACCVKREHALHSRAPVWYQHNATCCIINRLEKAVKIPVFLVSSVNETLRETTCVAFCAPFNSYNRRDGSPVQLQINRPRRDREKGTLVDGRQMSGADFDVYPRLLFQTIFSLFVFQIDWFSRRLLGA